MKKAVCTYEPRGEYGLEGFTLEDTYEFKEVKAKNPCKQPGRKILFEDGNYAVCTTHAFKQFFKEIASQ